MLKRRQRILVDDLRQKEGNEDLEGCKSLDNCQKTQRCGDKKGFTKLK